MRLPNIPTIVSMSLCFAACGPGDPPPKNNGQADGGSVLADGGGDGGGTADVGVTDGDAGTVDGDTGTVIEPDEAVTVIEWDVTADTTFGNIDVFADRAYLLIQDGALVRMLPDGTVDEGFRPAPSGEETWRYELAKAAADSAFQAVGLGESEDRTRSLVYMNGRGERLTALGADGYRRVELGAPETMWTRGDEVVLSSLSGVQDGPVAQRLNTQIFGTDPMVEPTACAALTPGVSRTAFEGAVGSMPMGDRVVAGGFIDTSLRILATDEACQLDEGFGEVGGHTGFSPNDFGIVGFFIDFVDFAIGDENIYALLLLDRSQAEASHLVVRINREGLLVPQFADEGRAFLDRPGDIVSIDFVGGTLWAVEASDGVVTTATIDTMTGERVDAVAPELTGACSVVDVTSEPDDLVVLLTCAETTDGPVSRAAIVHVRTDLL